MSCLGGEDRSSDGDVGLFSDGRCCTEIGRDSDILDQCRSSEERFRVGHTGEGIGTWLGSSGTKSSREESDMLSLMLCDLGDTFSDLTSAIASRQVIPTHPFRVSSFGKVLSRELLESPVVKVVFEVFKGQGVLENVTSNQHWSIETEDFAHVSVTWGVGAADVARAARRAVAMANFIFIDLI